MRKKKSQKKKVLEDFPVNVKPKDAKPTDPLKLTKAEKVTADLTWDELDAVDDIIEELGEDGSKNLVSRKKRNHSQCEDKFNERPGNVYPEIVLYWLSQYIKPEDIGNFAGINKTTYALTKRESFWRSIYNRYCKNHPNLPDRLRIENSYQTYGLRQRVIRALYHTYDVFVKKVQTMTAEGRAYQLARRRCVSVWFYKGSSVSWAVYFKFKKLQIKERTKTQDFITELGRIDANPDQDTQVLQVTCRNFHEVPPLMGMILSSVTMVHSHKAIHQRLYLDFNTGSYNVGKDILPECTVVLDTVLNMHVYDWWHPKYPHFDNKTPTCTEDDEVVPMLKKDFFAIKEGDFV